ncbi:MAG: Gfo/Idh/MocA family oxidoreductase [Pirellulaceae bacterium]|nr:Gfo/Idh/MocA family oxidoreductase [Pirellulaceae bacterium]
MSSRRSVTRRDFVKTSSIAAGVATVSGGWFSQLAAQESNSPNQKLNIAVIGTANRASANIHGVEGENIVALCDIDQNYLDNAKQRFTAATTYSDYRELLDAESKNLDAVVVSTADHHHAPATIRAIRAGLHVYCEKPLTHTVEEARLVTSAAKKHGVATQMGTQIHAGENYRRVVEIIQSGAIGDIQEVHVWVGKGWSGSADPTLVGQTPPENMSWDLWLGPAPERPYVSGRYHPANWRRYWDFGGGNMADMACHYMDLPFWALNLGHPVSCEAEGPPVDPDGCPTGLVVKYEFPARKSLPPVTLTWHDGDRISPKIAGERVPSSGVMFVGSQGKMFAAYSNYRLFPADKFRGFEPPAPTIPRSIGHHAEWIKACKDGSPTTCDFAYSGVLAETVLLGGVAFRVGKRLEWDAENQRATNCPEADQFIRKAYRSGWEV